MYIYIYIYTYSRPSPPGLSRFRAVTECYRKYVAEFVCVYVSAAHASHETQTPFSRESCVSSTDDRDEDSGTGGQKRGAKSLNPMPCYGFFHLYYCCLFFLTPVTIYFPSLDDRLCRRSNNLASAVQPHTSVPVNILGQCWTFKQ